MIHTIPLRLLIPILLMLTLAASGQDLVGPLFDQGMKHYSQQNWAGAVDYLGQVCDMSPNHHLARYYLVYSLLMIKHYPAALKQATILSERNPGVPQYATLLSQIQQTIAAQSTAKIVSGGRPGAPPKEVTFGGYNSPGGKTLEQPKMPVHPPKPKTPSTAKPETPLEIAIAHIDAEEFAPATQLLDELIKKEPKNAKALHYRGVVEFNQRKYAESRGWFQKSVALDPKAFETFFLLGDAANREGKTKEAEEAFQKATALKEDVFAFLNLADVKRKLGKISDAEEIYKKIAKIDPNMVDAKVQLADCQLEQGKVDDAMVMVNDVLTFNPANALAHFVKGKILYRSELNDDAISELKTALAASPDSEYYQIALAKALLKGFKTGEATELGAAVLKNNQESYDARLILAEALMLEGQTGDAAEHIEKASKINPGPEIQRMKALLAKRNGDNDGARTFFQAYISQDSNNAFAYLEYADFLEKTGDIPGAIEVFKMIPAHFPGSSLAAQAEMKITALGAQAGGGTPDTTHPGPGKTASASTPPPGKVRY